MPGHEVAVRDRRWLTAGITAFYMWRLYFLVFSGETRAAQRCASTCTSRRRVVTNPLVALAALLARRRACSGFPQLYGDALGIEHSHSLANWLVAGVAGREAHEIAHATELLTDWRRGGDRAARLG